MKSVVWFGKKVKLRTRYAGPYKDCEKNWQGGL